MATEPTGPQGGPHPRNLSHASPAPAQLRSPDSSPPRGESAQAEPSRADSALRAAQDLFVRRWGDMGHTWGINRTMAEIYALLYITARPLGTDDIIARLSISRGNASTNLRALCEWGIVQRQHRRGERREYFQSLGDVWEVFGVIAA